MKKTTRKKLALPKETLRRLTAGVDVEQDGQVIGGEISQDLCAGSRHVWMCALTVVMTEQTTILA